MMSNPEPKLLVSVRNASEARDALAGGADWIDLKEPLAGPLASVSSSVAREIAIGVAGRRPLSAALGELVDWQKPNVREMLTIKDIGVVKLGLADCRGTDWQRQWLEVEAEIRAEGKQMAAVIYADWQQAAAPDPEEVIDTARIGGSEYLLIDTWNKSGLTTLQILGVKKLLKILISARSSSFKTVLAGKIGLEDLPSIASLPVDIVAVRGAVCPGGRESRLDVRLVKQFRDHLNSSGSMSGQPIAV